MTENINTKAVLLSQLKNELTEAAIYARLAMLEKNLKNKQILESISADEASHARIIKDILGQDCQISSLKVSWTVFCARVFGITFTLKAMERGENTASKTYRAILKAYPQLAMIAEDEDRHEAELISMLNDERLNNMGAIVLGLNDALVELTGALAGFTFAIGETSKIAKLGLITGLAAAMSMAASAFLSARADAQAGGESGEEGGNAIKTAAYTGFAYIITVLLLVAPYILLGSATIALGSMLLAAFGIIAFFNFYLSVARGTSFVRGFSVMAGISTIVALISYGFGYLLR
ncbi:MAG: VIT1/CCC1 transporter family protein [Kiritimatiellae bacterium]|nr:VIT1/CCC1 transporter family protein [Kiritimatiellia bacterium]